MTISVDVGNLRLEKKNFALEEKRGLQIRIKNVMKSFFDCQVLKHLLHRISNMSLILTISI